ncbi:hypothetical protein WICMUC_003098 [Wickerhamomyces mucosus]|uniref:1,3-beta-glucanosyltransferase n=1 Tax=Wickerhamomyces mucosus TaxID=1378264 RepID=A0A9P8PNF8_9ASCO|nr:hypothetical protein WICMUC_003098 [Wickerhamomyces mucosus]
MLFKSLVALAASLTTVVAELPAIEIVGNKFFYSNNGSQFYIKGVAYQQDTANITSGESFVDPLADSAACKRDIPYLTELNTNTIRVYALNSSLDHTDCLEQLQDAGIYVIADLSEPSLSINRDDPSWTVELYDRYKSIVDEFQNYTNILGFFAGNEVSNDYETTDASAFVKAAVRDTKAYIKEQGYRSIPVGYSSNDDSDTRVAMADYFTCGDDSVKADFYGINMYEWCGESTFKTSGYEDRTEEFANITVPLFFSEYGCNQVQPREFTEVAALYSDEMTDVWSGGIVYMYFEETNNYGLVSIDGDSVSTLADFNNYKTEIAKVTPTSAVSSSVSSSTAELSCPTEYSYWEASTDLPPTPDSGLCDCVEDSASCVISDDVSEDDYSDLFSYLCGVVSCKGIQANGTTGEYGAYSFCSSKQQISFLMNLYYKQQGNAQACSFGGSASLRTGVSTASVCSSALSAAGSNGANTISGTVSYSAASTGKTTTSTGKSGKTTSTGTSKTSSNTSTGSSSSTSTSKSSASPLVSVPKAELLFTSILSIVLVGGVSALFI